MLGVKGLFRKCQIVERISFSDRFHQAERKKQDALYHFKYYFQGEAHNTEGQQQKPYYREKKNHQQRQRPAYNEQDEPQGQCNECSHELYLRCLLTNEAPKSQFIESKLIYHYPCAPLSGFVQMSDRNCTTLFLPRLNQIPQIPVQISKNRHCAICFLRWCAHNGNSVF